MPLVLVAILSVLVGCAVYLGTISSQRSPSATGFGEAEEEAMNSVEVGTPPPGYAYLQVSTEGPSLRDRVQGVLGVILLVGIAAATLAFALYELGYLINKTIETFLGE
jgi:hypothetical protein